MLHRWSSATNSQAPETVLRPLSKSEPLLIAQITDLHLGPLPTSAANAGRLRGVVERLVTVAPDLVLATGDLTEGGEPGSYDELKALLAPLQAPILFAVGNHDRRAGFAAALGQSATPDGFIQHDWRSAGRRILVLDTLEEGLHGGAYCDARLAWLNDRLAEEPETPTLIALHHPPARSGIAWMDKGADGPWAQRLAGALRDRGNIVGLVAGHLHRGVSMTFAGHRLTVAPSVAPQVALDLSSIRPDHPDQRPLIVAEPPGFALHLWTDEGLVSHFGTAGGEPVLARFDGRTRTMIQDMTETV